MRKAVLCLFSILAFTSLTAADQSIKLQYALQDPVQLLNTNSLEISQSMPGLKLNSTSQQFIKATLSIEAPHHAANISQPPFDALLRIQAFRVNISANQDNITFDSSQPGNSMLLAAISKILERPIRIHVDKKLNFDRNSEDVLKILNDIPTLKEIDAYHFLEAILQPMFAMAGKNLQVGSKFQNNIVLGLVGSFPATLNYEVTGITDNQVLATINGEFEPQTIKLKSLMEIDDKKSEQAELSISGTITGEAAWGIQNALLFNLKNHYQYNGVLKIGDLEWPFTADFKTNLSTSKH